jgi:hypothetical protein
MRRLSRYHQTRPIFGFCRVPSNGMHCTLLSFLSYGYEKKPIPRPCDSGYKLKKVASKKDDRRSESMASGLLTPSHPSSKKNISCLTPTTLTRRALNLSISRKHLSDKVRRLDLRISKTFKIYNDNKDSIDLFKEVFAKCNSDSTILDKRILQMVHVIVQKNNPPCDLPGYKMREKQCQLLAERISKIISNHGLILAGSDRGLRFDPGILRIALGSRLQIHIANNNHQRR